MSDDQREIARGIFASLRAVGYTWLHEGDCVGVDGQANEIWRGFGGKIHQHPPLFQDKRAFQPFDVTEEPLGFHVRDQKIVDAADALFAFPKGPEITRSGTWTTVRYARKQNKNIVIVYPSGAISVEFGAK